MVTTGEPDAGFLARDLLIAAPGVPVSMPCGEAVAMLLARPDLSCLAVVGADDKPLGLIGREKLLSTFSDPLRSELYRRRPIRKFLDRGPLTVDAATHVDEITTLIADRHPAALSTGFIVTADGRYAGVCSGIGLLSKVVALTRTRSADLEVARTRAEAATRAKSSFLAAMSHEIRTPLNSVVGSLELLEDAAGDQERRELTGAALSAAQTLLQILGDVLDFSKIESDRVQLESAPTNPAAMVRDIVAQLHPQARDRGVTLTAQVGAGIPERILGDPLRLRQIVLNIVGNALKFTGQGRIAVSVTRLWAETEGVRLRFEVADTGAGFAAERASRLFEAFTQEEASTTRRFGGTGLGLAICRKLVEAMGGLIRADGAPGGGATFWFEIPVTVMTEGAPDDPADALEGVRVLVIGAGDGAEAGAAALAADGARVERAVDVTGAAFDGPPPAVIALFTGPGDGAGDIEALARRCPVESRLVLSHAVEAPALARLAYRHGFVGAVMGPCPPAEIRRAVVIANGPSPPEPAAVSPGDAGKPTHLGGRGGGRPVLVIDDTATNQVVVGRQLKRLGLSREVADDGARGLELATTRRYAAILVDCSMPVMDGYEFTRRLRAWEAETGSRTPVIAMTAHALTEDIGTSLEAGMDYHLIKPVNLAHLAMVLDHWLSAEPAPPIDLARLTGILGETDPDEVREILCLFTAHADTLVARLEAAVAARDRDALAATAHAAKGAAHNAAAVTLIPIVSGIESGADHADWDDLTAATAAARAALDDIRRFAEGV